jgi:cyclic pyranopterin phosphate synthase
MTSEHGKLGLEPLSAEIRKHYRHLNVPGGDLRVSITAKCDMRCVYCHNEGQGDFKSHFMPLETLRSIVDTGLKYGIHKVRLTGGEPLLHPRLLEMIRMLKFELKIKDVGLNTNGVRLIPTFSQQLLAAGVDVVVVGLDYFDGKISKDSPLGKSSRKILVQILAAKEIGLNMQIATVYSKSDSANIIKLAEWCRDNGILFKVLEVSDGSVAQSTSDDFLHLVDLMQKTFGLSMGKTVAFNEAFGIHDNGNRVLFFHSHCRVRECHECSLMHMRVTSRGAAKPCILRTDTEYSLTSGNADHAMRRAIHNLGNPPERAPK